MMSTIPDAASGLISVRKATAAKPIVTARRSELATEWARALSMSSTASESLLYV